MIDKGRFPLSEMVSTRRNFHSEFVTSSRRLFR